MTKKLKTCYITVCLMPNYNKELTLPLKMYNCGSLYPVCEKSDYFYTKLEQDEIFKDGRLAHFGFTGCMACRQICV